jgi:hypothetical protein
LSSIQTIGDPVTTRCPIDGAELTVPTEWDHDIVVHGVVIHEAMTVAAAWVLFHIRKEHGVDALIAYVDSIGPKN